MEKTDESKKFSSIYGQEEYDFPGEQVEEKDVRGKEMTIYDFAKLNGSFGEFVVIDAEMTSEIEIAGTPTVRRVKRVQFMEGSSIIMEQLIRVKKDGNLPIVATIIERTSEKSKMTYRTLI